MAIRFAEVPQPVATHDDLLTTHPRVPRSNGPSVRRSQTTVDDGSNQPRPCDDDRRATVNAKDIQPPKGRRAANLLRAGLLWVCLVGMGRPVWGGAILREVFAGIGGNSVADLTNNPAYPLDPTYSNLISDFFEAPSNVGDNYGQRMHGWIIPPVSGDYTFWISSDDGSSLYLSKDENPKNSRLVAFAAGATGARQWGEGTQQSAKVQLEAGRPYYVSALQKEGGGGDHLAVRWLRPDGADEGPIPATHLRPWYSSYSAPTDTPFKQLPAENTGHSLNAVTWGNGLYVAVGESGKIITSSNGTQWRSQPSGTLKELFGVASGTIGGTNHYVAVGAAGTILESTDGSAWSPVLGFTSDDLFAVGYGDGTFLAVGVNSFVRTSDMRLWDRTPSPRVDGWIEAGTAVAYGNKQFIVSTAIANHQGRGHRTLWRSTSKGEEWTLIGNRLGEWWYRYGALAYGPGFGFLAVGHHSNPGICCNEVPYTLETFWSESAMAWSDPNTPLARWAHFSPDGTTWREVSKPDSINLFGATFGDDTFVCVGNNGSIRLTGDGVVWDSVASGTDRRLRGVTYGNGQFVAVGVDGVILTSAHGGRWQTQAEPIVGGPRRFELHGVAEGPNAAVAVGANGAILRSKAGGAWVHQTGITQTTLWDVLYASGRYVAVGDGGSIFTSPDAETWTPAPSGTDATLFGLRFLNGRFIAVGAHGAIHTSADGLQWTPAMTGGDFTFRDVAYGSGTYAAIGDGGTLLTSKDATKWQPIPLGNTAHLRGIAYGNGLFLAVGEGGVVRASSDGESWRLRPGSAANLRSIDFADGRFIAVGDDNVILTSTDGRSWSHLEPTLPGKPALLGVRIGPKSIVAVGSFLTILRAPRDGSGGGGSTDLAITTQPTTQLVTLGGDASLVVEVSGVGPFTYQWFLNDTAIPGAVQPALNLKGIDLARTGKYTVTITGPNGSIRSAPATIVSQPQVDIGLYAGLTVTGTRGQTYVIEYSEDLNPNSQWVPLDQITLSDSTAFWVDLGSRETRKRFYRATPVF